MRKKVVILLLSVVVAIFIFALVVAAKKPHIDDLFIWMTKTYDIECLDLGCRTFRVFDEDKQSVLMETVKENHSSSTFKIEVEREYRNAEDESYYLDLKVEGFLNDFTILNEKAGKINKKQ